MNPFEVFQTLREITDEFYLSFKTNSIGDKATKIIKRELSFGLNVKENIKYIDQKVNKGSFGDKSNQFAPSVIKDFIDRWNNARWLNHLVDLNVIRSSGSMVSDDLIAS